MQHDDRDPARGHEEDYASIVLTLEELVLQRATGTLSVTTPEGVAIHVGLRRGAIVSIVERTARGPAALGLMRTVRRGATRFEEDLLLPVTPADALPVTHEILEWLRGPAETFPAVEVKSRRPPART
jgi:hypothetical protein